MQVRYVGLRPNYNDGMYGTGTWVQGQVKDVPVEVGRKMVDHVDQYQSLEAISDSDCAVDFLPVMVTIDRIKIRFLDAVLDTGTHTQEAVEALGVILAMAITAEMAADSDVVEVVKEKVKEEVDDDNQEARDAIANMGKEQLIAFAQTNFRVALHPNIGVEKARAKVVGLIDQYGLK